MKKLLLIGLSSALTMTMLAQSYSLSVFSEDYMDLINSTSLNGDMTWDDPNFKIPIGFDFQIFDEVSDSIYISDFGTGAFLTFYNVDTGFVNAIIPFGPDIIDRAYDLNSGDPGNNSVSPISYLTEGAMGSRIFKIEWKNVGFFSEMEDDNESTDFTNFQLWFYEGTNVIDFHYGPTSVTQPDLCYDEADGPVVALASGINFDEETIRGDNFVLEGSPAQPSLADVINVDTTQTLSGTIPESTVYRFTPGLVNTQQLPQLKKGLVFPNPTVDAFNISSTLIDGAVKELQILNQVGQVVITQNNPEFPFDVSNISTGVYSVLIKTASESYVERLVKR